MNRYDRLSALSNALPAAVAVPVAKLSADQFAQYALPKSINLVLMLIAFGLVFQIFSFVFWTLYRGLPIMRRLLLGRQYVEGTWFIEVRAEGKLYGLAISRFESAKAGLRWSAVHYNLNGEVRGGCVWKCIRN